MSEEPIKGQGLKVAGTSEDDFAARLIEQRMGRAAKIIQLKQAKSATAGSAAGAKSAGAEAGEAKPRVGGWRRSLGAGGGGAAADDCPSDLAALLEAGLGDAVPGVVAASNAKPLVAPRQHRIGGGGAGAGAAAAEAVEPEPECEPEPQEEGAPAMQLPAVAEPLTGEITLPIAASALEQVNLLNQKHSVIGNYGGKCMVLSWERWEINQRVMIPTFQTFGDFQNRYRNRYVQKQIDDEVKKIPAGKYWLSSPGRLTYDKVVFSPGEPEVLPGNRLNLWRDFAIQPRKGSWRRLLRHIYRVLGAGDRRAGRYILRWLAWAFQNPGLPAEAVLALQGEEGAGKGTLARVLLLIFGASGLPISDPNMLAGQFSGHLQHCCFLFVDEAFWAGDVKAEGRLKSLVTEPTITIRPLYVQAFQILNMLHILMSSNNDWVVPAGHGSRRYAVFKVSEDRIGDFEYFAALNAEIDGGGAEAMLYDLLRLDLKGWHPKQIYETIALTEQKGHSLRGLDAWIETILQEGVLPNPVLGYPNRSLSEDLYKSAKAFDQYANKTVIADKLKRVFGEDRMSDFNNRALRGWAFPPLAECRAAWERRNGGRWRWHRSVQEWGTR